MERTRRKRKLTEKLKNYVILDDVIKREIKTEPDDDEENPPPPPVICCCLCKVSSGVKLLALFGVGPRCADPATADMIKTCIGLEISPEIDPAARICRPCLRQVEAQHAFWKQSLQCNEYAQNQMAADEAQVTEAPTEIKVCRFCLKIGGKLVDLVPKNAVAPDGELLKKIEECFGVEINPSDAVTKICRNCIQRIDEFLAFRTKHLPVSVFIKQELDSIPVTLGDEDEQMRPLQDMMDVSMVKVEPDLEPDLDLVLNVSDSDCSLDKNERRDPLVGEGKKALAAIRPELLELIGSDVEGRNFSVVKDAGVRLKVEFEGYQFRYFSERSKGGPSCWICLEAKLRNCKMRLHIDSAGMKASLVGSGRHHCHSTTPAKLLECPAGKGISKVDGKDEPFWLFYNTSVNNKYTRSLFLGKCRYFLFQIKNQSTSSVWHCGQRRTTHCRVILHVDGIFQRITTHEKHNHKPLSQKYMDGTLSRVEADFDSTEVIDAFQAANPEEKIVDSVVSTKGTNLKAQQLKEIKALTKEKDPVIFKLLEQEDPQRDFESSKTGGKFKLHQNGYQFRYFGRHQDGSTLWKCICDSLHHCLVIARLSEDGKKLGPYRGKQHSHKTEPAEVFGYPLGKRMVCEEPLWLLSRVSMYYESRCLIYQGYAFIIQEINRKGVVRWCCWRKHSCRALLISKGDFDEVFLKKGHSHEKPSSDHIASMIEKRPETLLEPKEEDVPFKTKLLSYPSTKGQIWDEYRNEYETFYILNSICTGEKNSYGVVFRGHKYSFASLDQNGTSRWMCGKTDYRMCNCKVVAVVEGLFESICVKDEHNHEQLPESQLELMIKRCVTDLMSTTKDASCLKELPLGANESNNILSMLARHDPERNFSVSRAKHKLVVTFEKEDFRIKSHEAEGSSIWTCTWLKVRKCPVAIRITPDAKVAIPVDDSKQHNHSDDQIGVCLVECGKAPIYDEDRSAYLSYYLYSYQSQFRTCRAIIYLGHRYYLHGIGNNRMSTWKCRSNCRAYARVEDALKVISLKNEHSHEPLSESEILEITESSVVDKDLLPASSSNPSIGIISTEGPLRPSALLRILSKPDPDRNFQFFSRKDEMKIHHDGFDYYFRSSNKTHSLWKCVNTTIRSCRATLYIDNNCKTGTLPEFPKHNHYQQLWDLYDYPLGESTIMDAYSETAKPFWFLMQHTFLRPCPILIYENNKLSLCFITESGDSSKWRCVGHQCRFTLTVTGTFDLAVSGGVAHNHSPMPESKRLELIEMHGGGAGRDDNKDDDDQHGSASAVEDDDDQDVSASAVEDDEKDDDCEELISFVEVKMEAFDCEDM